MKTKYLFNTVSRSSTDEGVDFEYCPSHLKQTEIQYNGEQIASPFTNKFTTILSADHFHLNSQKEYIWDFKVLGFAHSQC